ERLAGADDRLAGVLAAADLQLRRGAAGRRRAVRVRGPRSAARGLRRRGSRHGGGGAALSHILVVANETVASEQLLNAVRGEVHAGVDLVTVLAPVNAPASGYVVYEDTRRAAAGRRLDQTLAALREGGISAHGFVVESSPVEAVRDALAQLDPSPDRIVVSTHPEEKSGWL